MFKIDKGKFEEHVNAKWKSKVCPMCHGDNWSFDENIQTTLTVDSNKNINTAGPVKFAPYITVTCMDCGYTMLINGIVANSMIDTSDNSKED